MDGAIILNKEFLYYFLNRSDDSIVGVKMNAVNLENPNAYLHGLLEVID